MSASYANATVAGGHVEFDIRNEPGETRRAEDGFAIWLETELRGDGIYAVGRKTGEVRERYPDWLYT